jgi:putative NIF3 family GTP cyclohydrolase 1 type 2
MNSVLLAIDLTKAVADEAIERSDSVIIAYRMFSASPCEKELMKVKA